MAIPTFMREQVLLDTLDFVLALEPAPAEVLIVDQTANHEGQTDARLGELVALNAIRWLRTATPSIPSAMNEALVAAEHDIVLFLDDDIVPSKALVGEHARAHDEESPDIVAGRVIQPWESEAQHPQTAQSSFSEVEEFMGGNFSVRRKRALELGGFDENFVRVAYRFEAEFAARIRAAKGRILLSPRAIIHHLKAARGGTRQYGLHHRTIKPDHAVGEYYFLLRTRGVQGRIRRLLLRPVRAIASRFHLRHPWWIPVTLVSEIAGLLWAIGLVLKGPRYVSRPLG